MVISICPVSPGSGSWRSRQHRQGSNGEKDSVGEDGSSMDSRLDRGELSQLCAVHVPEQAAQGHGGEADF